MAKKINLTPDRLRQLDSQDMLGKTLALHEQIDHGIRLGREFVSQNKLQKPNAIDWFGLGGSAVAGDLLQAMGYEPPAIPMQLTVRRYLRESNALRLIASYSGNTIEAIRAFQAVKPNQIWFTASSGGRLEELSKQDNVPHLKLPGGYPPRAAIGYMLGAMMAVYESLWNVSIENKILDTMISDAQEYAVLDAEKNRALNLAAQFIDRIPVIYTVEGLAMPAVAQRFSAQLAENAKIWSHVAHLPEMAHNEIESFEFLGQVLPTPLVILLGSWDASLNLIDPRPAFRSIAESFSLSYLTLDPVELWSTGLSRAETVLRTTLLLDALTVYLAILRANDPGQIPILTKLKIATTPAG